MLVPQEEGQGASAVGCGMPPLPQHRNLAVAIIVRYPSE
jgi:hypothetical protein